MRSNVHFIINPISGTGRQRTIEKLLKKYPQENFKIHYTRKKSHAFEIAKELSENETCTVVAVGGDGTVNEIGKALIETPCALGVIPCGSGNGLARSLGIPLNLEKAVKLVFYGNEKKIDSGIINHFPFIGVAGIGFDAHVAWEFSTSVKRGFKTYINVVRKQIGTYKPVTYQIEVDGKKVETNAMLITIANSSQWGNGAIIAPGALLDDGLLQVAVLKPFPLLKAPYLTYLLFAGKLRDSEFINFYPGKEVRITSDSFCDDIRLHVDGEAVSCTQEINIKINPLSLNIITL
jgi:YegS/Rv2252/BmrU family lipid kinase